MTLKRLYFYIKLNHNDVHHFVIVKSNKQKVFQYPDSFTLLKDVFANSYDTKRSEQQHESYSSPDAKTPVSHDPRLTAD